MMCHSDVLSWIHIPYGLMYIWDDVKVIHCFLFMIYRKYQMDELQSGPLMVKSLTGRCFVKSKWLSG